MAPALMPAAGVVVLSLHDAGQDEGLVHFNELIGDYEPLCPRHPTQLTKLDRDLTVLLFDHIGYCMDQDARKLPRVSFEEFRDGKR